jgi:5-methylcytosine-specific restriction endonuclease McrA
MADSTVVAPGQLIPYLADADIERIVFDGPSRVIDVGVRQRFFTGALRRAIEVRDRHCRHPSGCDVPAQQCEIDHVIPYSRGGITTQGNGRCWCKVHNRQRSNRPDLPPP